MSASASVEVGTCAHTDDALAYTSNLKPEIVNRSSILSNIAEAGGILISLRLVGVHFLER